MTKPQISILGIDFTSRPSRRKPIICAHAQLHEGVLRFERLERWTDFASFEAMLAEDGPWVAGMDFPFSQARKLFEGLDWPGTWQACIQKVETLSRQDFRSVLEDYKRHRAPGDRHHRRVCDRLAASQSPQTLFGTPVGLMFYEGAPRLFRGGVCVPFNGYGAGDRVVLEAYPGLLVRGLIGKRSYKNDTRAKQTNDQSLAREEILTRLLDGECRKRYGFDLQAPASLTDDPGADDLDAFLCCIQAAWGWLHRESRYGAPADLDHLEGWICDPAMPRG
jgi:hypothetical protein